MLGEGGETFGAHWRLASIPGRRSCATRKTRCSCSGKGRSPGATALELLATARAIAESCGMVREGWNGFNVLHPPRHGSAASISALCRGRAGAMSPASSPAADRAQIELLYLLGADEIDTDDLGTAFVIYQGHHGDRGARRADVDPAGGRLHRKGRRSTSIPRGGRSSARRAIFPPGDAREDWKILRALSGAIGRPLPLSTVSPSCGADCAMRTRLSALSTR